MVGRQGPRDPSIPSTCAQSPTSLDGTHWYQNGTYTHNLGQNARIGLVSMARAEDHPEFKGHFEYVRVYELKE